MSTHKFRIGERLRFQATGLTSSQSGVYEVLALMPQERGAGFQYRLKSTVDNHQRVALEDALSRI
jgi:hypothetical protein